MGVDSAGARVNREGLGSEARGLVLSTFASVLYTCFSMSNKWSNLHNLNSGILKSVILK